MGGARHQAALEGAQQRWGRQARTCAADLIRDGVAVLTLDHGQVRGRLIRFWRGDSVLELQTAGPDPSNGGTLRTRLSRQQEADAELIAFYLLQHAALLDDRTEHG